MKCEEYCFFPSMVNCSEEQFELLRRLNEIFLYQIGQKMIDNLRQDSKMIGMETRCRVVRLNSTSGSSGSGVVREVPVHAEEDQDESEVVIEARTGKDWQIKLIEAA